ncbi:MAG: DNA mismatch repair endonuclease MutL [Tissierellia bacterium]|nr:DNA mismatch repair endonuclease MutL [Tissierellia bacterium]
MIKKLDDKTIEKIAAGEVIESPKSIIKELVENSIDAGSDFIVVEIKNGGKTYIRVSDNGRGIEKNQLQLAFDKHTTSKINDFRDLYDIYSLGFRGEALASIVSVSKVTGISKTEDAKVGAKITFDKDTPKISSIASNSGTSILVEDLFYNLPARKKFLKSDILETNSISKLMYALAIGANNISFKYIKNENVEFSTNKSDDFTSKVAKLFDQVLADNLIEINGENDTFKIRGFISNSNYYRGNRSLEYIYVNNRFIESKQIRDRIELAYKSLIPVNRFPAYFLFIETNPKNLDVNVHPSKKKIKFLYEDTLISLLDDLVEERLNGNMNIKTLEIEDEKNDLLDFSTYENILEKYNSSQYLLKEEASKSYEEEEFFDPANNIIDQVKEGGKPSILIENTSRVEEISLLENKTDYLYKTSILKRYSIFEKENSILILDHRRASEKINLKKYMDQYQRNSIPRQILLEPIIVKLREDEMGKYYKNKDEIENLGFENDLFTESSLIIRSVPAVFDKEINSNFIHDLIDIDLKNEDYFKKDFQKLVRSISFRKGNKIDKEEAEFLLNSLFSLENPYKTQDGKPTMVKVNYQDLEKYFER